MRNIPNLDDTIVAIATATGVGSIGIIRLSGKDAVVIADQMFITKDKKKPSAFKSFGARYGWVVKTAPKNEIVDEALLMVMRAPKSYTKEDVVEISCHGGIVSLRTILAMATELGARLAEPGEFTKRAFLNGRMDLIQAEAVADMINARTETSLNIAIGQLHGHLSSTVKKIKDKLTDVLAILEATWTTRKKKFLLCLFPGL